jgi:hypothetical protein
MVEDKYSKNWRTSQKTNETFSYLDEITHEELKNKVQKHYDEKSKDIIEIDGYFHFPIQFKDKDTKKDVQMVYRFTDKEKAKAKADAQGDGSKYGPRKVYYETFEMPTPVEMTNYAKHAEMRKDGYTFLTAEKIGTNGAAFYNQEGVLCGMMGKVYKVEL